MQRNVFKHILDHGSCMGYEPTVKGRKTRERPGSKAKIDLMARRVQDGKPLFEPRDSNCFAEGGPC